MGEVPRYTTIRPNCGLKAWSPHCSSDRRSTASDTEHFEGHTQIAGGSSCRRNVQEATPSAFQGRSTVFRCQIEVLATGNDVRVRSSRGSSDLLIRGKDVEPAADTGLACPAEAHGRDNRTSPPSPLCGYSGAASACIRERRLASPSIPSWNQIAAFLQSMQRLRDSVGFAA